MFTSVTQKLMRLTTKVCSTIKVAYLKEYITTANFWILWTNLQGNLELERTDLCLAIWLLLKLQSWSSPEWLWKSMEPPLTFKKRCKESTRRICQTMNSWWPWRNLKELIRDWLREITVSCKSPLMSPMTTLSCSSIRLNKDLKDQLELKPILTWCLSLNQLYQTQEKICRLCRQDH